MRASPYSFGHPQIFVFGSYGKKEENHVFVYKYIYIYIEIDIYIYIYIEIDIGSLQVDFRVEECSIR